MEKCIERLFKKKKKVGASRVAQGVRCLLSNHETLNPNPTATKTDKQKTRDITNRVKHI
jgi:hypothetical protein